MPNIDDLRSNAKEIILDQLSPQAAVPPHEDGIPTIVQETSTPIHPQSVSMVSNKPSKRIKADLSSLPKKQVDTSNDEFLTVLKESVKDDILKEGGEFDQYVAEKRKEYEEYIEELELNESEEIRKAEMQGLKSDSDDDFDLDAPAKPDTTRSYKEIDILSDVEEGETDMENNEVLEDDFLEEEYTEEEVYEEEEVVSEGEVYYEDEEDASYSPESQNEVDIEEETIDTEIEMIHADTNEEDDDDDDFDVSDNDIQDEDDISDEEKVKILKNMVSEKIRPTAKKLDISSFSVAKKVSNGNEVFASKEVPAAKWVLPNTGIVVRMRSFSGAELEQLRAALDPNSDTHDPRAGLQIIYDHIASPKPETFGKWSKSISYFDYDHLFFAVYIASFSGANYIPVYCGNAHCTNKIKTYLTDDIKFMDMIKFKDDAAKERFKKLYKSEAYNSDALITEERVPVSDKLAIGFSMPSLFSAFIEQELFDTEFSKKFQNTINVLPYLHQMYQISQEEATLYPVGYKIYENNIAKTLKSRVKRYDTILNTLTADEYSLIDAVVSNIAEVRGESDWTYQYPETTCPHCNFVNPAAEDTARAMVFTRNQLGRLASF